jgi:glycosyltransferase involved in cell wall biosynthesis
MMYKAIRQADAYIALTPHERAHLIARSLDARKIHIVGGGFDEQLFAGADGSAVRARYGWGSDPIVIAMHRQSPLKRLDQLIRAMPAVWHAHPRARLLLAGARTSHTPYLESLAAALPTAQRERVTFVHNFDEEEKPGLLAAADVFVHPSINESFGIVLVEAWACGKPVVGTNQGAIASVIDDGQDGLLFDPARAPDASGGLAVQINALLRDPALRARMGEAGRRKALTRYTWDGIARQVRAIYADTLERSAGSRR